MGYMKVKKMKETTDKKQCGCGAEECCRHKSTPRSPEELRQLQNRLNRMTGQLSGIGKMLEDNRYCGDILMQIAAVESALQAFGYQVLQKHLESCVVQEVRDGNMEIMQEVMELIRKLK